MSKKPIHTTPDGGKWKNQRAGSSRASGRFDTQAEAIAAAKQTAKREKVEHLIHGRDGAIRDRNSYGNDPHPPKG